MYLRTLEPASEGSFTSKDPIGFNGGSPNIYGYVLNNPINLRDPSGNNPLLLVPLLLPSVWPAVVGTVAVGSAAVLGWLLSKRLPLYGPPDQSLVLPDNNGGKKQQRFYDENGNPAKDIDWGHPDHDHGTPHVHDWFPVPTTDPEENDPWTRGPGRTPKPGECP